MPTAWQTFPVEIKGGLISNLAPLQQGLLAPGSARRLVNFEPSVEGGYRRIQGYTKFSNSFVPPYGEPLVQGSGQTGGTINLANIFRTPQAGDTLTITGVTGTYTVDSVTYNSTNKTAAVVLTASLASSPADKAAVVFGNNTLPVLGISYFGQKTVVYRGADLWESSGSTWTKINKPSYGTVLVSGGAQTGSNLTVDGLTDTPQVGDTFSVGGIEKVYTIISPVTVASGVATVGIAPSLASSPADNASVTFLSTDRSSGDNLVFSRYNVSGSGKLIAADGINTPFTYDGSTFINLTTAPSDVIGADHVVEFKNHFFFAKDNTLTFTAPYNEADFTPANGAGNIIIPHRVTGLIVFREQLIIFSTNAIHRLVGNTVSDFQLQPISQDIGCVRSGTVQEVGGDIAFLGPDGIRLLSATDRIGDFGLAVASRPIQSEVTAFVAGNTRFNSCVVRGKNQYRLFGYSTTKGVSVAEGILGTQFADQTSQGMAWAELRGLMVTAIDSIYSNADSEEVVVFANTDGFVYRMESGSSFDTGDILAVYYTPFFSMEDARLRKTFYKLTTFLDPDASITGTVTPKLDFDDEGVIQPTGVDLLSLASGASYYGSSEYGFARYGAKLRSTFTSQIVGSGNTVSFQYVFEGTDQPFSLDALAVEYLTNDRQ